jgi:histidinol-phosphate phosphatase family protein
MGLSGGDRTVMRARQISSIRLGFHRRVAVEPIAPRASGRQRRAKASREVTVFLDRDGVLVRNRSDYVKGWDEVEIVPGAFAALARLRSAGARILVATNQSAVGRGIVRRETVDDIHDRLARIARAHGGPIDGFLVCPHRPDDGCQCRKPKPGLLMRAQRERGLDLSAAFMVGDQASDALAALAAGCTPILLGDGAAEVSGSLRARTLGDAVDLILHATGVDS